MFQIASQLRARCRGVAGALFAAAFGAAAAALWLALSGALAEQPKAPDRRLDTQLERLALVMRLARDRHFLKPEPSEMLEGALRGMLVKLDPEIEIFTKSEHARLAATPATMDMGLTVRRMPPQPRQGSPGYRVIAARDASASARAGLRSGDLLTHIDGRSLGDLSAADVRLVFASGQAGFASVRVERTGIAQPFYVLLERRATNDAIAPFARLIDSVLVVRLPVLDATTIATLTREIAAAESKQPLIGLVLDLRDTGGDNINAAIDLADALLDQGIITSFDTRAKDRQRSYAAKPGDIARGKPITVLVNAGTANAAEVFAAALQDNKRATLVGAASAGRAIVREPVALGAARPDTIVTLTTGRYLSPSGRRIDQGGIKPDLVVATTALSAPCRDGDVPDDDGAGSCAPRSLSADPAVTAALAALPGKSSASAKP